MRSGKIAHNEDMFTIPISVKVEMSWNIELKNILVNTAILRSMSPVSLAKRLIILPIGLPWKNDIGARRIEDTMLLCKHFAAVRLDKITQKEFAIVIKTCGREISKSMYVEIQSIPSIETNLANRQESIDSIVENDTMSFCWCCICPVWQPCAARYSKDLHHNICEKHYRYYPKSTQCILIPTIAYCISIINFILVSFIQARTYLTLKEPLSWSHLSHVPLAWLRLICVHFSGWILYIQFHIF